MYLANVIGTSATMLPKGSPKMNPKAFHVTKHGVTLKKGDVIPANFIENPFGRIGSYGQGMGKNFVEKIRIDAATPQGRKGPNTSHFHLNRGSKHKITNWPYKN